MASTKINRFKARKEMNLAKEESNVTNMTDVILDNVENDGIDAKTEKLTKEVNEKNEAIKPVAPTESTIKEVKPEKDNYVRDSKGNIRLKADGTPAQKPGRKKIKEGKYVKLSISMPIEMYDAVHDYLSLYRENMTEYVLSLVAKDVNENYEENMNKIEASKADPTKISIKRRVTR